MLLLGQQAAKVREPNGGASGVREKAPPEDTEIFGVFKFRGRGQKNTPVVALRGAVDFMFSCWCAEQQA